MKNLKLGFKILLVVVPLVLCLVICLTISVLHMKSIERDLTEIYHTTLYGITDSIESADRDFYQALTAHLELVHRKDASADGKQRYLDEIKEKSQAAYDGVHNALNIATSNESLAVMTAEGGSDNFESLAQTFDEYYDKLKDALPREGDLPDEKMIDTNFGKSREAINTMGQIVETWAAQEKDRTTSMITRDIIIMSVIFGIVSLALIVVALLIIKMITTGIKDATAEIVSIADGDLSANIDTTDSGNDEVGTILNSSAKLAEKLRDVISETLSISTNLTESGSELAESAGLANTASSQVSTAVNEVAEGAISQSQNVQTAATNTDAIGNVIDVITDGMTQLDEYSKSMKESCDNTMNTLERLIVSNSEVSKTVKDIENTINATNQSAQNISAFSDAIMDIASQTNLLSLNASIEAARAGESGKGFAVVADEIRELADQSRQSADEIKGIIDTLLADTGASVKVMEKLNESIASEGEQITSTKSDMLVMSDNVNHVSTNADIIKEKVVNLNKEKNDLVNIIQDLSAISEQNTASAEETTASMEELNATFAVVSTAAIKLQNLARDMEETISFFKV